MSTPAPTPLEYLRQIAARGGRSTSPAKQAAARRNGKRGGRPRKQDSSNLHETETA